MATTFAPVLNTSPIAFPCSYDPTFKVEALTHEPLWAGTLSTEDVAVELMTLCAELEPLIVDQVEQHSGSATSPRGTRRRAFSNTFETHANLLVDKMTKCIANLTPPVPSLLEYLNFTGLNTLYPRSTSYVSNPYKPTASHVKSKSPMDGYFQHLSTLNQVSMMCQQLRHDATNLSNHKYIAHQIALLYQSLNQLGNIAVIQDHKTNIETTFKKLKNALTPKEGDDTIPQLPPEYSRWLVELTSGLVNLISSFAMEINHPLLPAIGFLQQKH
ncbi:uncharacterized protein [Amphiura filiformis]|uniref:uncharacterized protein n=1 Tax=Amphiura filiformis TaxID=82378 RepID=UPI003B2151B4